MVSEAVAGHAPLGDQTRHGELSHQLQFKGEGVLLQHEETAGALPHEEPHSLTLRGLHRKRTLHDFNSHSL